MPSRLRRHDEYGHVHFVTSSCFRRLHFFRHDSVKQVFAGAMKLVRDKFGVRWLGYVIMPEQVHLLVLPQRPGAAEPTPISAVLNHLKGASGRRGKDGLREIWRQQRTLGTRPLDNWATGAGPKPLWKPHGYRSWSERWTTDRVRHWRRAVSGTRRTAPTKKLTFFG